MVDWKSTAEIVKDGCKKFFLKLFPCNRRSAYLRSGLRQICARLAWCIYVGFALLSGKFNKVDD